MKLGELKEFGEKILVLVCCAPCCSSAVEWLARNGVPATLFFYNPNIWPEAEYFKRKAEVVRLAAVYGLPVVDTDYSPEDFARVSDGLESCAERGERCSACFLLRLSRAAECASVNGFAAFASTLAVSRWKSRLQVEEMARAASNAFGVPYLFVDWRREGLQSRARAIIKELGIYEQRYCGCRYSGLPRARRGK